MSKLSHQLIHLVGADVRVIPWDTVSGLPEHAPNLSLHLAAHKLIPWGFVVAAVFNASLGSVVKPLIVADPQGGVPRFVVRPAVIGVCHGVSPC